MYFDMKIIMSPQFILKNKKIKLTCSYCWLESEDEPQGDKLHDVYIKHLIDLCILKQSMKAKFIFV